jgi:cell division protein FtsZ
MKKTKKPHKPAKKKKTIKKHVKKPQKKHAGSLPKKVKHSATVKNAIKNSVQDFSEKKGNIKIRIFGIGGGGCSIVKHISEIIPKSNHITFTAVNTDAQSLNGMPKDIKTFILGKEITNGLGCGMNADLGQEIAHNNRELIQKEIEKSDFCIIISTLGGGTGSGMVPIFSQVIKSVKKPCLGIFTLPFEFEGEKRKKIAANSLENIEGNLSATIVIPNENIFKVIDPKTAIKESFLTINRNLAYTLKGLLDTIYEPGLINVDYADFMTTMEGSGKLAYINSVEGERKDLIRIMEKLLLNPLVKYGIRDGITKEIIDPDRILFNISGPSDLKVAEINKIAVDISAPNLKSKIIFGISLKGKGNSIRTTLLVVGHRKGKDGIKSVAKGFGLITQEDVTEAEHISDPEPSPISKEAKPPKPPKEKKTVKNSKKKLPIISEDKVPEQDKIDMNKFAKKDTVRRNALEAKKVVEEQVKREIEQEEEKWDVPAFLRIKKEK